MFSMPGPTEWVLILVIVLVLFGAKRLPSLGSSIGEGIRNFKKSISGDDNATKTEDKKPIESGK